MKDYFEKSDTKSLLLTLVKKKKTLIQALKMKDMSHWRIFLHGVSRI